MTRIREPYFTLTTPYPEVAKVVCYKETWGAKFTEARRIQANTLAIVARTLNSPSAVCAGTTNPGYVAFVIKPTYRLGKGLPLWYSLIHGPPRCLPWRVSDIARIFGT